MKDTSLKRQRDRDLFQVYRNSLTERDFRTQQEAVDYARKHTAPMFYVSAQCLVNAIGRKLRGDKLEEMNNMSRKRYAELFHRFINGKKSGRFSGMSRIEICEILVEEEAPEFYIGLELAKDIIFRESTRHNKEMAKRWR